MGFRTKNDNVVEATDVIEIIDNEASNEHILKFNTTQLSDEAYYMITAKNYLGEDSTEIRLRLISK